MGLGKVLYTSNTIRDGNTFLKHPFGMPMQNRSFSVSGKYRYGFNGMEKDNDIAPDNYDFGARIYDARLGRWLAVDPLWKYYHFSSPYAGNGNSPIMCKDIDGKRIQIKISDDTYVEYYEGKLYRINPDGSRSSAPYTGSNENAKKIMELLNQLKTTKTGLEIVNYVQNHSAIQKIETISGVNGSSNQTENFDNPYLLFNISEEKVITTVGEEVSPLHIKLGHELAHFLGKFKEGPEQYESWYSDPNTKNIIARNTEKFASHYENMLRSEFGLNLRKCYTTETLSGEGARFHEGTRLLNDDNLTSSNYPQYITVSNQSLIDLLSDDPDIEVNKYKYIPPLIEYKVAEPYNYRTNNPSSVKSNSEIGNDK